MLLISIVCAFLVSLISFIGVFTLAMRKKKLQECLVILIGFSAGGLIGGAFFNLLPEALGKLTIDMTFIFVITGFVAFFILEKVLHWRHCHDQSCQIHPFVYLNLIGEAVHNFIDGLVIISSFFIDPMVGFTTTIAIALHEIPQEIGDFGVLVYGGFSRKKALLFNFLSALTAIVGVIFGYFLFEYTNLAAIYLLPIAAGGFLYIAASDLMPEMHKENDVKKSFISFAFFMLGIIMMFFLRA